MALHGQVALVISDIVLLETERNLAALPKGAVEALAIFRQLTAALDVEVVAADEAAVCDAATYTHPKDAPIVAAARVAAVDYLVSLDRRHLVDVLAVAARSGLTILLPGDLLQRLRAEGGSAS